MAGMIREMKKQDWQRVQEIYQHALIIGKSTFQTDVPSYEEWNQAHLEDCRYVIVYDDKVVGWCTLGCTSARQVYAGVVEVSIYIDSHYQSLGLGKQLLQHLCVESEKKGYWCLYSSVFAINEASLQLHKKCGFREIGYREKIAKDRFGQWQDTILFEKRSQHIF